MRIKFDLSSSATEKLIEAAVAERRSIEWQAEVMLSRALGVPVPEWQAEPTAKPAAHNQRTPVPA